MEARMNVQQRDGSSSNDGDADTDNWSGVDEEKDDEEEIGTEVRRDEVDPFTQTGIDRRRQCHLQLTYSTTHHFLHHLCRHVVR